MEPEKSIRAFIAIDLPDEVKRKIAEVSKEVSGATIVKGEQLHLTLAFFEKISADELNKVMRLMDSLDYKSFPLSVSGIGVFTPERPRVVFVEVKGDGTLKRLYGELKTGIADIGMEVDEREFTPHITIARLKSKVDLKGFTEKHSKEKFGDFECGKITLYKSTLTESGPIHEKIFVKELG